MRWQNIIHKHSSHYHMLQRKQGMYIWCNYCKIGSLIFIVLRYTRDLRNGVQAGFLTSDAHCNLPEKRFAYFGRMCQNWIQRHVHQTPIHAVHGVTEICRQTVVTPVEQRFQETEKAGRAETLWPRYCSLEIARGSVISSNTYG